VRNAGGGGERTHILAEKVLTDFFLHFILFRSRDRDEEDQPKAALMHHLVREREKFVG
jgi:hypothetical protein